LQVIDFNNTSYRVNRYEPGGRGFESCRARQ